MQSHHCQHARSLSKELGGGMRLESCNCKYIVKYLRYDAFDGNILNSRYVRADNSSEVHFLHFHFSFEVLLQISWRKVATAPGLAPEALVNQSWAFTAHMLSYHMMYHLLSKHCLCMWEVQVSLFFFLITNTSLIINPNRPRLLQSSYHTPFQLNLSGLAVNSRLVLVSTTVIWPLQCPCLVLDVQKRIHVAL